MTAEGHRRPLRGLRPSRAESEDLLDGKGSGPLHELLAAASGPAHREEVAGEALATGAFVAARRNVAPGATIADDLESGATIHRRTGWWRTPTGLVAALVLALASAGVAVGTAATMLRDAPPAAPPPSSAPAPVPGGAGTTGPHPLSEPVRTATCRAWQAAGASTTTNRTSDAAFTPLISAAGGSDNVDDYCAATAAPDAVPSRPTPREHSPAPATSTPPGTTRDEGSSRPDDPEPAGAQDGNANSTSSSNSNEGRGVGPPATPPGRATDRNGPAGGRAVGPPEVPPGQNRGQQSDGSTPPGQG
jgi:hypothetical protein